MDEKRMEEQKHQFDKVIINGKEYQFGGSTVSYEQLVKLAFGNERKDYTITVSYRKGSDFENCTLLPGDQEYKDDGMIINVAHTGNS